jgi:hypothetical protein
MCSWVTLLSGSQLSLQRGVFSVSGSRVPARAVRQHMNQWAALTAVPRIHALANSQTRISVEVTWFHELLAMG